VLLVALTSMLNGLFGEALALLIVISASMAMSTRPFEDNPSPLIRGGPPTIIT